MATFYTCTQVTPEVYAAYQQYSPSNSFYNLHELLAVTLSDKYGEINIFPVCPSLNVRHLREFGSADPQSDDGDINTLVSIEEFFYQLLLLELEQ